MIEKRLIFPILMFAMAGVSFVYGTWQYLYAQQVAANADARVATMLVNIEQSSVTRTQKQQLYSRIANSLPKAPTFLGIDVSGSFASQGDDDQCTNDGQRSMCRALVRQDTSMATVQAICGVCDPIR